MQIKVKYMFWRQKIIKQGSAAPCHVKLNQVRQSFWLILTKYKMELIIHRKHKFKINIQICNQIYPVVRGLWILSGGFDNKIIYHTGSSLVKLHNVVFYITYRNHKMKITLYGNGSNVPRFNYSKNLTLDLGVLGSPC